MDEGENAHCRPGVKGRLQTGDFVSVLCYYFHHWELTINRLTGALLGLTLVIFRQTRVIFMLTGASADFHSDWPKKILFILSALDNENILIYA